MLRSAALFGLMLMFMGSDRPALAAEAWTDPKLTVTDGLALWLDASAQNAARAAMGKPPAADGESLPALFDGSGLRLHLVQKNPDVQPRLRVSPKATFIAFDGKKDHLSHSGTEKTFHEWTAFVVAAPEGNIGNYCAILATRDPNRLHEPSGFTIDLGLQPSGQFDSLNTEGYGFGEWHDVKKLEYPFGTWHIIEMQGNPAESRVAFQIDGKPAGSRRFNAVPLRMDEILVGARYLMSADSPPRLRGFFQGNVAEILLYERLLAPREAGKVRNYLAAKYEPLTKATPSVGDQRSKSPLAAIPRPPAVQVLVPGFTVRQLPIDLTNVNNLQYRDDGKLVALAYNGNVYLLSDADGDGLEDTAELFWDNAGRLRSPIGMALTPKGYERGNGLFVPSKAKCSLIVDTDDDDKADKEIIVADGWHELFHGVDALGAAFDPKDGSLFFGLGTANYTAPYLVDKDGKPHYSLTSERGTILKVAPDFKHREIYCTGIRFPVGMAFNREGDLFCTDQEGATWVPNGNPFDELLHIQQGRHYGFPSRHPRYLPNVIDEPSTYDYTPQHQSACGLFFNEPVNGGPVFGPAWWAGNAIVCGYSRGKIYRTELVKSQAGYAARTEIFASLTMLTENACVSPKGDLVVAVHSGGPDWGSGPDGKGKLYKIVYHDQSLPQPARVWASGPQSVSVAFDRPLDLQDLKNLTNRVHITYGRYVRAGDQYEVVRPGYEAVDRQMAAGRFELAVYGVGVTGDRRTLILNTAPHPEAVHYAITFDRLERAGAEAGLSSPPPNANLPQLPTVDLHYDLYGLDAAWKGADGSSNWTGWLPHLDLTIARAFTTQSAQHDEFWNLVNDPGTLTLSTKLDLVDMLRPAIQPGSSIDFEWPEEEVTLVFTSDQPIEVRSSAGAVPRVAAGNPYRAELTTRPRAGDPLPIEITLSKKGGVPHLDVHYFTAEDGRPRVLQLRRFILPWATLTAPSADALAKREIPQLKGASWSRGRKVFLNEKVLCSKCHRVNGEGGTIGPDLSNLAHRDYASVVRDITEPSLAINPDYISYVASLKDGRVLTGSVQTHGDALQIGDEKGNVTVIKKSDVDELKPTPISTMPKDVAKEIPPEQFTDLLAFLLTAPPKMPVYGNQTPPPPRTRAEVDNILAGAPKPPGALRPIHIVLVAGPKDHGTGEHDYPAWQKMWRELMELADKVKVTTAWEWPEADDFQTADSIVFYQRGKWTPERAKDVDAYLARGGGLVYIHYAVDGGDDAPGFAERIGLAWRGGAAKFRHGALDLDFSMANAHPIARNFDKVHFYDESYWQLTGASKGINLLATGIEDGKPQPLLWTYEPGKGRVFVSIPGHFAWTFDDPLFRVLLLRGIAWTAGEPVDRFNDLATVGARMATQ